MKGPEQEWLASASSPDKRAALRGAGRRGGPGAAGARSIFNYRFTDIQ